MNVTHFPWRLFSRGLTCSLLALVLESQADAQCGWFRKPCPEVPCPVETTPTTPAPTPTPTPTPTPPITPPTVLPSDTFLQPVTTAALGSDTVSINMFGDKFGAPGSSTILVNTPRTFQNFQVYNYFTGSFLNPPPATNRLAFANTGASGNPYFQSTPGNGLPVKVGQVIPLENTQPFINTNLQTPTPGSLPYQIQNGQATITNIIFNSDSFPSITADGKWTESRQIFLNIPNPGSGGVVGRAKLSEDLNPLPRDRFIFNYDYFNNTQLTSTGQDVNRFVLGFEKTFFDRNASIEVRLPFASSLNSDIVQGAETTNMEFGDIRLLLKALLYNTEKIHVGGGLGIYLPTADDTRVFQGDGTELVRIQNHAVILTPYIGVLLTPTPRLFSQIWFAADFDTNGDPVQVIAGSQGLQSAGRLQDQTWLQCDLQVGYWLIQPYEGSGLMRGLAPFVELHYGTTMNNADFVQSNGFVIGNLANRLDVLNLSAGFSTQVGDNLLLMLGAVAPLQTGDNREFDYQIGLRASWFFGPTAAARRTSNFISSF